MFPLHRVSSLLSPEQLTSSIVLSQALTQLREKAPKEKSDKFIATEVPKSEVEEMNVSSQNDSGAIEKQNEKVCTCN